MMVDLDDLSDNQHKLSTLVDLLGYRAQNQSGVAYTFLQSGDTVALRLTYKELDLQARGIAARLQSLDGNVSSALLLYPPGLEFIAAFFGCLYAGGCGCPRLSTPA